MVSKVSMDEMAKQLISKAIEGKLTEQDRRMWRKNGHLFIHWLRQQFERRPKL